MPSPLSLEGGSRRAAGRMRMVAGCTLVLAALLGADAAPPALDRATPSPDEYVREFESSYGSVRTLRADFTQEYSAWGRTRVESGLVYLARGGKMRWEYQKPEAKLFISDGKELLLYIPSEKQLTRSSARSSEDVRVPLAILLSRLNVRRAFSRIDFDDRTPPLDPDDRVLRAYPKPQYDEEYRDVLVELTPDFDIRRLTVTYPDGTTMQFTFDSISRNVPVTLPLFKFAPPAGTEIIQQ
jgi:outer membrane lipoprotein carrier protein